MRDMADVLQPCWFARPAARVGPQQNWLRFIDGRKSLKENDTEREIEAKEGVEEERGDDGKGPGGGWIML